MQQAHRVPHLVPHIVCHVVSQLGQQGMHDGWFMEAHVLHFGVVLAAAALQNTWRSAAVVLGQAMSDELKNLVLWCRCQSSLTAV